MDFILELIKNAIISLIATYPGVATFIFIVGTLRLIIKPIMTAIDTITLATPTDVDNSYWDKIKASDWFKAILWFIDWFGSIKIKTK